MGRLKSGLTKIKRLITIDRLEDEMITETANFLNKSKSEVHKELRMLGYHAFRKKYGLNQVTPISKESKEIDEEEKRRLLREVEWQKYRKERLRKKILDYEHTDETEWQPYGR